MLPIQARTPLPTLLTLTIDPVDDCQTVDKANKLSTTIRATKHTKQTALALIPHAALSLHTRALATFRRKDRI